MTELVTSPRQIGTNIIKTINAQNINFEDYININSRLLTNYSTELYKEWPEIIKISFKILMNEKLNEKDELWIKELAEASGWDKEDIIEELKNIDSDPSERSERYRKLFEIYFNEAQEFKDKGDTKQAGEKIWGAILALIKYYAAIKGIPIAQWSRGKVENFIANNVEDELADIFRQLVDSAEILHRNFYESDLDEKAFEIRWKSVIRYLNKVISIIFKQE